MLPYLTRLEAPLPDETRGPSEKEIGNSIMEGDFVVCVCRRLQNYPGCYWTMLENEAAMSITASLHAECRV